MYPKDKSPVGKASFQPFVTLYRFYMTERFHVGAEKSSQAQSTVQTRRYAWLDGLVLLKVLVLLEGTGKF